MWISTRAKRKQIIEEKEDEFPHLNNLLFANLTIVIELSSSSSLFLCMCVFTLFVKQRKFIEQNKLDVGWSILYVPDDGTRLLA